jgi:hypothetical protein
MNLRKITITFVLFSAVFSCSPEVEPEQKYVDFEKTAPGIAG